MRCWRGCGGTGGQGMCLPATGASRAVLLGRGNVAVRKSWLVALVLGWALGLSSCTKPKDRDTVVIDIESSPTNLDIRIGSDAQAEHIGALIFDSVVKKDEHYNLQPAIATAWEWTDPRTLVLHIRQGVRFHDGKMLDADDVAWSIDSMHNGADCDREEG